MTSRLSLVLILSIAAPEAGQTTADGLAMAFTA